MGAKQKNKEPGALMHSEINERIMRRMGWRVESYQTKRKLSRIMGGTAFRLVNPRGDIVCRFAWSPQNLWVCSGAANYCFSIDDSLTDMATAAIGLFDITNLGGNHQATFRVKVGTIATGRGIVTATDYGPTAPRALANALLKLLRNIELGSEE